MDATYRSEFRELFDVRFAQFDAKLEQRIAELRSELHVEISRLLKWYFVFWLGTLGTLVALLKL